MAIPTSRTREAGTISINTALCQGCGRCIDVCKDFSLVLKESKAAASGTPIFGCIGCGHCMAVCPNGAIEVRGRTLSPDDLFPLCGENPPSPAALLSLLQKRRSIREFQDVPVEKHLVDRVLEASRTAPMGLPPSDVNVLVLESRESVRKFTKEFCSYLEGIKWFFSGFSIGLMRPVLGKENAALLRDFASPLIRKYTESMAEGRDLVTYDAPVALYFYGSPFCDPADPIIAATYAMLTAESLGLGTCMLGAIHPLIQSGGAARRFREKQGIRYKSREGLFLILGHPRVSYSRGIRRTFASIERR